jgi:hypothetical protein
VTYSQSAQRRTGRTSHHARLLRPMFDRPRGLAKGGPLDAIIVPAARRGQGLQTLIALAAQAGTLLVVLASHDCDVADVADIVATTPGSRAVIVQVPDDHEHELVPARTSGDEFRWLSGGRRSNLSHKRNLGLLLARLRGWRKVLFLDDDIRWITLEHLARVSHRLDSNHFVSHRTIDFPDNSVVCHANRLSGEHQGVFVSGAALGVHTADLPLEVFPDIYNEDWFAMANEASDGGVAHVGDVRQLEFNPFDDPVRAVQQEFGDLLAEGLYDSFSLGDAARSKAFSYWEACQAKRVEYIEGIQERLEQRQETHEFVQAARILEHAKEQVGRITTYDCLKFLEAWQEDRREFAKKSSGLSGVRSYRAAFDELGLPHWRTVAFGESKRLDSVELGQPQSLSRSRSSMRPLSPIG